MSANQILHIDRQPYIVCAHADRSDPLIRLFAYKIDLDRDVDEGVRVFIEHNRATWTRPSGLPTGIFFSGSAPADKSMEIELPPPPKSLIGTVRSPLKYEKGGWYVERKKKGMISEELVYRLTDEYVLDVVKIAWPIMIGAGS